METVYAIKDIDKDQEILTSYIELYMDKATRQENLKTALSLSANVNCAVLPI